MSNSNLLRETVAVGLMLALAAAVIAASEHRGQVRFGEVPVHGATVRATQGDKAVQVLTDPEGRYLLPDLADGTWTIQVEMPGFETLRKDVTLPQEAAIAEWPLKMRSLDDLAGKVSSGFPPPAPSTAPQLETSSSESSAEADDRLLINGSVINGAATPFALQRAFGNVRTPRFPYRGTASINGNTSFLDAKSYSLTGQGTPQPDYGRVQASFTIGGPFQIPRLFRMGSFTATYSRTQNTNATLQSARMPTEAERIGDFSTSAAAPTDPETGAPFPDGFIPPNRISPQARALLDLYPLPNLDIAGPYNYEVPVVGTTHGDSVTGSINNIRIGRTNQLSGSGSFQSTRSENADLFGFTDRSRGSSASAAVAWIHRFTPRIAGTFRYDINRSATETLPHFSNRQDISGDAGITGTDRDPRNWGPPALSFAGGIAGLTDGTYAFDRSDSNGIAYTSTWIVGRHAFDYGADYRWQRFDLFSQRDPRGGFTFTRDQTGNDFADFLLGVPSASAIAFGNADKYFRQSLANLYVNDDFRLTPSVTLKVGVRWEYESPITEQYGRLVNLDVAPGFAAAAPIIAGTSSESLVRPDKGGVQPRLALAWRPRLASSLVVRAGYGVYRETSVYRSIADQMAQQSPLSKSLSVQNTPEHPLTLADGFSGSPTVTATTFAVDPGYRVGTAQNWTLSAQQDMPASMQVVVTYLGIKGTHVPRRILPNTFPTGAADPCPACPTGFVYLTSDGTSNRHSGTIDVRRRQRNGFEASARYTLAKAIDDAGLGANQIAQNWLDRGAERGLSSFDRRHELVVQGQYTSAMLAGLGSFWDGWRGALLKEWTLSSQLTVGSGTPLTPVYLVPVSGTGVTGTLRPNVTGAALYDASSGAHVNVAAFAPPAGGEWGNAARNSITGPSQFSLNASIARTFRFNQRVSMDLRVDATNVLNRVTFPSWNTIVSSSQFGLPPRANPMRTIQPSMRLRF